MNKQSLFFKIEIICIVVLLLSSCGGPRITTRKINMNPKEPSTFAHQSLRKFVAQNPGASVVVRDPKGSVGAVSGSTDATKICTLIERGLMMKGFNPRDRMLFENTLQKMKDGSDYSAIHEQTGTDLIFEVTHFSIDPYVESTYTDQNGRSNPFLVKISKKVTQSYSYLLYGFSIEIKVILLQENLIGGVFRYTLVPCTDGCDVEYYDAGGLRYRASSANQAIFAPESSRQRTASLSDKVVADFISDVVIPSMFREMGDTSLQTNNMQNAAPSMGTNMQRETGGDDAAFLHFYSNVVLLDKYDVCLGTDHIYHVKFNNKETIPTYNFGPNTLSAQYLFFKTEIPINIRQKGEYYIRCSIKNYSPKLELMDNVKGKKEFDKRKSGTNTTVSTVQNTANVQTVSVPNNDDDKHNEKQVQRNTREQQEKNVTNAASNEMKLTNVQNSVPMVQKSSYDFAKSVSDLLTRYMDEQQSKLKPGKRVKYVTDQERLLDLAPNKRVDIANFILSIATSVNTPLVEENEIAIYCSSTQDFRTDGSIVAFLDGECVGVGSTEKGLFTNLPKEQYGRSRLRTLTFYTINPLNSNFNSPINFSLKNFYQFEWNRGKIIRSN